MWPWWRSGRKRETVGDHGYYDEPFVYNSVDNSVDEAFEKLRTLRPADRDAIIADINRKAEEAERMREAITEAKRKIAKWIDYARANPDVTDKPFTDALEIVLIEAMKTTELEHQARHDKV